MAKKRRLNKKCKMTPDVAIDILNMLARKECPDLRLNFVRHITNKKMVLSCMDITDTVVFSVNELLNINSNQLTKIFKDRVNHTLRNMESIIKESKLK